MLQNPNTFDHWHGALGKHFHTWSWIMGYSLKKKTNKQTKCLMQASKQANKQTSILKMYTIALGSHA